MSSSKIQPASNDPSNNDSSMLFKSLENSFRSDEDEMTPIQNTANMEASLGQMIRGHRKGSTTTISTEGKASKPSVVPPRRLSLGLVSVKEREQMSKLSMATKNSGKSSGRRQTQVDMTPDVRRVSTFIVPTLSVNNEEKILQSQNSQTRESIRLSDRKRSNFAIRYGTAGSEEEQQFTLYQYMLLPTSSGRLCWDVFIMLLLIYVALMAPYR